jgi:hypothetical protein
MLVQVMLLFQDRGADQDRVRKRLLVQVKDGRVEWSRYVHLMEIAAMGSAV